MDIPRYALIAASLLLALMLLGEWTQFSNEHQPAKLASAPMVEISSQIESNSPDAPIDESRNLYESGGNGGVADLPAESDIAPSASSATDLQHSDPLGSLVSVETDVLEIMIDLQGGDVVGAALRDYPNTLEDPSDPFVLLERNAVRTYVAQSGLVGRNGIDQNGRATYRAKQQNYSLTGDSPLDVVLEYAGASSDLRVIKVFRFEPGSHTISVRHDVENTSDSVAEITPFAQLKRDSTPAPAANDSGMGMRPFLGAALTHQEQRFEKFDFEDMAEAPFKADIEGGWVAMVQHYFVSAWIPEPSATYRYRTHQTKSGFNIVGYTGPALTLNPGESLSVTNQLYVGPKNQAVLADLAPHLDLVVDYGWLWWIAQPLFWLLTFIQGIVANWGIAIIVLTLLVKLAFFQLSAAGYKSMARMRKVQPRMVAIREEYANDKAKQSQAMMELYKKEKINPLGGCFPILVQMPVFIALYWVLMESVELRQAPFALWIEDLSVMDPYFVLPILMGASMYYMQKLNPPPPDPMQAKIMQWMPIVFTFFFLWFPAGLVLYWVCNNLLSMAQQYVINRRIESGAL